MSRRIVRRVDGVTLEERIRLQLPGSSRRLECTAGMMVSSGWKNQSSGMHESWSWAAMRWRYVLNAASMFDLNCSEVRCDPTQRDFEQECLRVALRGTGGAAFIIGRA